MQPIARQSLIKPLLESGFVKPTTEEQRTALKGQVEEFSALVYAQLFAEMREAGKDPEDEGMFGGGDTNVLMGLFDQALGKSFAHRGGDSLSQALYQQLSTRFEDPSVKGGQP